MWISGFWSKRIHRWSHTGGWLQHTTMPRSQRTGFTTITTGQSKTHVPDWHICSPMWMFFYGICWGHCEGCESIGTRRCCSSRDWTSRKRATTHSTSRAAWKMPPLLLILKCTVSTVANYSKNFIFYILIPFSFTFSIFLYLFIYYIFIHF